ncbi:hypothetical protein SAMN04488034_10925 [Salinimicrobium catena]|uniref:Tyr recombinase domain-containing protein n=1 Tax=Salinimicrobium catena TaxID=390640 RepID=A0A1H5P526_9FLAO|nr:phage integrase SAM-like domain-containing protein [Salinimicrobium catena]SDL71961.1 hypothetical protein SAMN04488140_10957 [Salinimicrobium catena]SEF09043.1 hypothetical protein SAMN04488034_10925 [Salinimicrobium catena]
MATVNFLVKGKDNPATIHVRFKEGNSTHDITKNTGKVINPKYWSKSKKAPLPKSEHLKNLASDLRKLKEKIIDSFSETPSSSINGAWLQKQIDIHNKVYIAEEREIVSEYLTDAIQHIIDTSHLRENSKGSLGLSKSRRNSYKNLLNIIEAYQGRKKIKVKDVDISFGKRFLDWMLNNRKYSEGYSKKKIDDLKTVCADAAINGLEVNHQLKKVKGGKTKNDHVIYLSPEELNQIKNTSLSKPSLENTRKWLLLGCNLGQRGQDLLNISEENFVTRKGLDLIELTQQKGGKIVTIPVLPATKEILAEGLPDPISLQKFNDQLKVLCEEANLKKPTYGGKVTMVDKEGKEIPKDEDGKYKEKGEKRKIFGTFPKYQLISSHVCRRSFATNHYGILPTPLIMQITAHGTEKMFLQYIGKSSMDYAQQIADFYNNHSNEK